MIISILNSKGGVGKSTLASNLARALQLRDNTVLIIDTDRQGTMRDWGAMQREEADYPTVVAVDRPVLGKSLEKLHDAFSFIVVDGAAKLESMLADAVKVSDVVLIPVQPSPPDIWAVRELVDLITARQTVTEGKPRAAFVVSRQIKGTHLAEDITEALESYGLPVFEARTTQRVVYGEAFIGGATVLDLEPEGKGAAEILAITDELEELLNGRA